MNLFRRKSITDLQAEATTDQSLKRALGALNLTTLGIGAIIGTGIFILTGTAAAQNSGPAVVLSFVLAGLVSAFAALCYSEFASLVPMSGSAYTYGYTTLGELFAWIIGWDLVLEYAVGAIAVSVGWSGYVVSFLRDFGIIIPPEISAARGVHLINIPDALAASLNISVGWQTLSAHLADQIKGAGVDATTLQNVTAVFNLPAVLIVGVVTALLVVGIKESAGFNNIIVFVKLAVVLLFIVGAASAISAANWHPFIPPNTGKFGDFGWSGVMRGASLGTIYPPKNRLIDYRRGNIEIWNVPTSGEVSQPIMRISAPLEPREGGGTMVLDPAHKEVIIATGPGNTIKTFYVPEVFD